MREDNDGRRKTLRTWLTHDPFYRRIKDAFLMILALFGASGMAGYDLPTLIRKFTGHSEATTSAEGRSETRATRSETRDIGLRDRMIRVEVSLESIDKKVDKLEDKIDRLLESARLRGR